MRLRGRLVAAAGLVAAGLALAPAAPALAVGDGRGPLDLGGVPAVGLLRSGRVLVLRPDRLEVVLDGRLVRSVGVRQPVDLAQLPSLVGDPAYAAPLPGAAGAGVRLAAVLAQRPDTVVTGTGLHLQLADTGGAGPARLTGTRARFTLRDSRVDAAPAAASSAPAAGFRYLHASNLSLDDVTLAGLGLAGAAPVPALRADGGSVLALRGLSLVSGGPGVEVRDAARLAVEGLDGHLVGGAVLTVQGGAGAGIRDVGSRGASGPAVRLRGAARTAIDGVTSWGDAAALVVQDADGVRAGHVRGRGDGIVLGGRGIELSDPDVDAQVDGVRVAPGAVVVVRGGWLRGRGAAVAADATARTVLESVSTAGALRGPVHVAPVLAADARVAQVAWWDRPVRSAGAVALVVLLAGILLEVLRGRRRGAVACDESVLDGELALDLGERRVH